MKKEKRATQEAQNETNLAKIFSLIKKREELMLVDKTSPFNNTELRIISEIFVAKTSGARLISTQLAKRVGVTRSAISQIVNRLEERGVVVRTPDDVDKKIAYIEITENFMDTCDETLKETIVLADAIMKKFGAEKFERLYTLYSDFINTAAAVIKKK